MRFGIENKNVAMAGGHTAQFSPFNMGPNESQQSKDAQSISKYQGSRDSKRLVMISWIAKFTLKVCASSIVFPHGGDMCHKSNLMDKIANDYVSRRVK